MTEDQTEDQPIRANQRPKVSVMIIRALLCFAVLFLAAGQDEEEDNPGKYFIFI